MEAGARRRGQDQQEEDVVYAPPVRQSSYSEPPSEGYVPSGAVDRDRGAGKGGGNALGQYAQQQQQPSGDYRAPRPAPVIEHRPSYQDMRAAKGAAIVAEHNPYSVRDRDRAAVAGGGGAVVSAGNGRRQGGQEYESIVTR
jgi:hypothetical protein